MGDFKNLIVYQKAYTLAMDIFKISQKFPKEEKYALTDQIRRSSRSVCANLAEGYRKRKYLQHFILKLSDCEAENTETEVWLDFARDCSYITEIEYENLLSRNAEVRKILFFMITNPEKFL